MLQIQPISESSQTVKWWSIKTETNTTINLKDISLKSIDPQHIGYFIRFITGQQVRWQISAKKTQLPSINPGVSWPTPAKPTLPIPLKVFYFVNSCIGGDKYKEIMEDHLRKIKSTGVSLASNFELNLACVSTPKTIQIIHKMCQDIFPELCARKSEQQSPRLKITSIPFSTYEQDCLHLLWKDAQSTTEETIYCYAHAKGVSMKGETRKLTEVIFSNLTLLRLVECTHILATFNECMKLGGSISPIGFAWHNFWLAKSSYLKRLPPPALTSNRYYYEYWLSGINKDDANISNGVIRESPREQQHNSQQDNPNNLISLLTTPGQFNLGDTTTRIELETYLLKNHEEAYKRSSQNNWPI